MDNPNQTDATEGKDSRNARLTEHALTSLALEIQEGEQDAMYGTVAVEVTFKRGVIQQVRRVRHVTEQ